MLSKSFIKPQWPAADNIVALTTTRLGGVSQSGFADFNLADHVDDEPDRVALNRLLLAQSLDAPLSLQWLQQVHGTDVVEAQAEELVWTADAAFTRQPAIGCCVLTADCLPILLTTIKGDTVAAIHAGWRGLATGIVENTLQAINESPENILVWLGPAIGPCHFEVGAEVRETFLTGLSADRQEQLDQLGFAAKNNNKYMADLYAISKFKLQQLGVTSIYGGDLCSYCDESRLYSYRRQPETGRMLSLIYIRP